MITNIHQIWIQGKEHFEQTQPDFYKCSLLWTELFPNWNYKLWSEVDFYPLLQLHQMNTIYDQAPNFACKSDIARYIILYEYGGLYVDTDYEPFTNFSFLFPDADLVCVWNDFRKSKRVFNSCIMNNCFIYSGQVQLLLFRELLDSIKPWKDVKMSSQDYTMLYTGPKAFSSHVKKDDPNVRFLPHNMIEVVDFTNCMASFATKEDILKEKPFAIGVHRCNGSWRPDIENNVKTSFGRFYEFINDSADFVMLFLVGLCIFCFIGFCVSLHLYTKKTH